MEEKFLVMVLVGEWNIRENDEQGCVNVPISLYRVSFIDERDYLLMENLDGNNGDIETGSQQL